MKFLQLASLLGATVLAAPADVAPRQTCSSPKQRKDWTALTSAEKTAYLNAAVCITKKPSQIGLTNATRHDDFAFTHADLYPLIHDFAAFLPWHRYYLMVYEAELKACGYTGVMPYWNWVADSSAPSKSAVWSATLGFGGNGVATGDNGIRKRVIDGPFKNLYLRYWNADVVPHWLSRDWAPAANGHLELRGDAYSPSVITEVNANTNFDDFRYALETGPHAAVHGGVGAYSDNRGLGDIGLQNASPNDPLFFLHHTQVDRLWWLWQQANPSARLNAYNGNNPNTGSAVSLNDALPMGKLAASGIVKNFMDTKATNLCYKY